VGTYPGFGADAEKLQVLRFAQDDNLYGEASAVMPHISKSEMWAPVLAWLAETADPSASVRMTNPEKLD
jgi:hypothetical protein